MQWAPSWVNPRQSVYKDLQKFYDSIDVRDLLRFGGGVRLSMRVAVVDLQVHLGLRALRLGGAFATPQIVANSILTDSKFCNVYARHMLYGTLEEVHRAVPLVKVDQHVDDLAQCAVGRETAVVKEVVEATEIITFACDRLSPPISPKSTTCCSDVKTKTLLRRGLLELGIQISVTGRTRDQGIDTEGRKTSCWRGEKNACARLRNEARNSMSPSHQKSFQSPQHQHLPCASFGAAGMGMRTPPCKVSDRALRTPCPKSGRCVPSSIAFGLTHNEDPAVQGIECIKCGWCFGTAPMSLSARACAELGGPRAAPRRELPLDEGWVLYVGGHVCPF